MMVISPTVVRGLGRSSGSFKIFSSALGASTDPAGAGPGEERAGLGAARAEAGGATAGVGGAASDWESGASPSSSVSEPLEELLLLESGWKQLVSGTLSYKHTRLRTQLLACVDSFIKTIAKQDAEGIQNISGVYLIVLVFIKGKKL